MMTDETTDIEKDEASSTTYSGGKSSDVEQQNTAKETAVDTLQKVASRRSEIDPAGEPPDGGLNAWLKVLGCFLIYSNVWYGS